MLYKLDKPESFSKNLEILLDSVHTKKAILSAIAT